MIFTKQTSHLKRQSEEFKELCGPSKFNGIIKKSAIQNEKAYTKLFLLPVVQKLIKETRLFSPMYNDEINVLYRENSRNLRLFTSSNKNYVQSNKLHSFLKSSNVTTHRQILHSHKFNKNTTITSQMSTLVVCQNQLLHNNVAPSQPFYNSYEAIRECKKELADYELNEIKNYSKIYYVGRLESKLFKINSTSPHLSWNNKLGYYKAKEKDHIQYRYEILSILGYGSQAIVYKCIDHKKQNQVAAKIYRNTRSHKSASQEAAMLQSLNTSSGAHNIVQFYRSFQFRGHFVIVEELLGPNLFDIIRQSNFQVSL